MTYCTIYLSLFSVDLNVIKEMIAMSHHLLKNIPYIEDMQAIIVVGASGYVVSNAFLESTVGLDFEPIFPPVARPQVVSGSIS